VANDGPIQLPDLSRRCSSHRPTRRGIAGCWSCRRRATPVRTECPQPRNDTHSPAQGVGSRTEGSGAFARRLTNGSRLPGPLSTAAEKLTSWRQVNCPTFRCLAMERHRVSFVSGARRPEAAEMTRLRYQRREVSLVVNEPRKKFARRRRTATRTVRYLYLKPPLLSAFRCAVTPRPVVERESA
jgi:hypothetical protein